MNYIQRWLDAQASIEASQTDRLATIAQSFAGQSVPVSTIKEIIKAHATNEYKRLSLAATIAVCLDRPNHIAIAIADQLCEAYIGRNWSHEDLDRAIQNGRLVQDSCGAWRIQPINIVNVVVDESHPAWQQLRDGLRRKSSVIGDDSCRFNARSTYLRCTVNPCGPCADCPHFEERDS